MKDKNEIIELDAYDVFVLSDSIWKGIERRNEEISESDNPNRTLILEKQNEISNNV